MNRYLSKPEKVSLTRIMLLVDVLDQVIADYQKAKGVDAEFLKYLRTCRTWGMKALKRRYDFLDLDAAKDFTRHIHHICISFIVKVCELAHCHLPSCLDVACNYRDS